MKEVLTSAQKSISLNMILTVILAVAQLALLDGTVSTPRGLKIMVMVATTVKVVQLLKAHGTVPDGFVSAEWAEWQKELALTQTQRELMADKNTNVAPQSETC